MYHNPIGYALGLLDELEGAERAGRGEVAAEVRAELTAAKDAALGVDPETLGDEGKAALLRLRQRLAAGGRRAAADTQGPTAQEEGNGTVPVEDVDPEEDAAKGRPRTTKATGAPESAVKPKAK